MAFISLLIYNASKTTKDVLAPDVCLIDNSFVFTEGVNIWFRENILTKDAYMIYCAFLMDFLLVGWTIFFLFFWNTTRLVVAMLFFYPLRSVVQSLFLIRRPVGFLWFAPGVTSITVPYFDTNDFYYSGHVGGSTLVTAEYASTGWSGMMLTGMFIVVNEWIMLMLLRTHYFIDLITGLAVALIIHRLDERLSYIPDVLVFGLPH